VQLLSVAKSFDRGDVLTGAGGHRHDTRTKRYPVHVYGACAAGGYTATELGAGEVQMVAQDP
jgi:hypothetical protein